MSSSQECMNCGRSGAQLKHVTRTYGKGANLLVIENIPMWSCSSCGESYFTAQTMHEIERIKTLRKSVAKPRSVPVAAFQEAAA
jgi:YgiT-type zinc finger domain-containing protein